MSLAAEQSPAKSTRRADPEPRSGSDHAFASSITLQLTRRASQLSNRQNQGTFQGTNEPSTYSASTRLGSRQAAPAVLVRCARPQTEPIELLPPDPTRDFLQGRNSWDPRLPSAKPRASDRTSSPSLAGLQAGCARGTGPLRSASDRNQSSLPPNDQAPTTPWDYGTRVPGIHQQHLPRVIKPRFPPRDDLERGCARWNWSAALGLGQGRIELVTKRSGSNFSL